MSRLLNVGSSIAPHGYPDAKIDPLRSKLSVAQKMLPRAVATNEVPRPSRIIGHQPFTISFLGMQQMRLRMRSISRSLARANNGQLGFRPNRVSTAQPV